MERGLDDLGRFVLRLSVGVLVLLHGLHKALHGVDGIAQMVQLHHLPAWFANCVYLGELAGPTLIILGVFTRLGALLVITNMLFALWFAHLNALANLSPSGGYSLELEAMYLSGGLAIALLGAGRLSLGGKDGTLN